MSTAQLPDLLDYIINLPGYVCLVGDMNINFDNPLQSLTKHTSTTLRVYNLVQVINKFTNKCGHITDWIDVRPDDDTHLWTDPVGVAALLDVWGEKLGRPRAGV